MGSDSSCLSWEATTIGMASGTLEVYPISSIVAIGMGTQNSFGEGKYSPQLGSRKTIQSRVLRMDVR